MNFAPFAFSYVHISEATECNVTVYLCLFLEMLYVNKSFVLVFKISQYLVSLRTIPHGTERLVRIFITRNDVSYLSNNYVPYHLPKNGAYRTVLPSLVASHSRHRADLTGHAFEPPTSSTDNVYA